MTVFQRRRLVVGLVGFALLFLFALLFAIPKIEDSRTAAADRQLRAAGITDVQSSFSGRDGTLSGPVAQEEAALLAVTDRDGMRSVVYEPTDTTVETVPSAGSSTTVAAGTVAPPTSTGQTLQVSGNVDGTKLVLSGAVANDAEKKLVADAAAVAFGPVNVTDQVVVAGGERDVASAGAINLFSQYLAPMALNLRQGSTQASGTTFVVAGTAFSQEAAASLAATLEAYKQTAGLTVSGTVQPGAATDVPSLQASLNDLLGRTGIRFASGSAAIDDRSRQVLDVAAQVILAGPAATTVFVDGHTDNVGAEPLNQRVSELRAQAVRGYLISKGVPAARLQARGFGSTRPIADNATPEGRAQNRRIEFVVNGS